MADWPEQLPPWPDSEVDPPARLTFNQFSLLMYILIESHADPTQPTSFVWSPKAFLERTPTASESVTLSKRLKGLVTAGYVRRSERSLEISALGKNVLLVNSYWLERGKLSPFVAERARTYLLMLDMLAYKEAIRRVRGIARAFKHYALVKELDGLAEEIRKMTDDALRRIRSNNSDDT